eukprot:748812-Hanusia_phi.AAC.1
MLVAKTRQVRENRGRCVVRQAQAYTELQRQFSHREVKKTYAAVVEGKVEEESGVIDIPIGGKEAKTEYRVVLRTAAPNLRDGVVTTLLLHPLHGRTHQIRIHCADGLKASIVGDRKYGRSCTGHGLCLAAIGLTVKHPQSGEMMEFCRPEPERFGVFRSMAEAGLKSTSWKEAAASSLADMQHTSEAESLEDEEATSGDELPKDLHVSPEKLGAHIYPVSSIKSQHQTKCGFSYQLEIAIIATNEQDIDIEHLLAQTVIDHFDPYLDPPLIYHSASLSRFNRNLFQRIQDELENSDPQHGTRGKSSQEDQVEQTETRPNPRPTGSHAMKFSTKRKTGTCSIGTLRLKQELTFRRGAASWRSMIEFSPQSQVGGG